MRHYCIIETDDGYTIVERGTEEDPVTVAEAHEGVLVDPGPYAAYDDALDAVISLQEELADESASDVPAERPLEERYEIDNR